MAYTVNVSIACQFDDTSWDYMDKPVYTESFDDFDAALFAYYDMGGVDMGDVAERFHAMLPDCKAFEAEVTITKDDCGLGWVDDVEWFENERIWTEKGWIA